MTGHSKKAHDSHTTHEQRSTPIVKPPAERAASLEIYDTTLRDGAQAEDVSFSAEDKVRVAQKLDELGVHFIEGGWPGANPKDIEFFRMIKTVPLKHASVIAFGSTRKASHSVREDPNLQALLAAETKTITLFGKTWSLHVTDALGIKEFNMPATPARTTSCVENQTLAALPKPNNGPV